MTADVEARAKEEFDAAIRMETAPMSKGEMVAALCDYDVVMISLGDHFTAEVFAEAGHVVRCKLLANVGVGFNHIDVAAATAAGVAVTNTPGAVTDATADIGLTLMLMTARRAGEGERAVRAGAWEGWHPVQFLGTHMSGRHVGILGMGRIGQAIARRCHFGFGMVVSYVARSDKELSFPATRCADVQSLAASVDFLVVAVPGGSETQHLVDADVFESMKSSGFLINIARGEVVDEAALIHALETKQIAGAGLDVYEFEPKVPEALSCRENVTLLPHLGTAAEDVRSDMGQMALDNVAAFINGQTLPNSVS
ncbi:D-glycerate dehydrogenase [Epibacterium ulvae]|uniref:2-hydroxyacid dehydrogenase n=1 Tax=Epibacterium ulvae TaxID=1156985 RepID=UPI001BFC18A7|nr:D-glycerate dehydrogenase [Epibacterium ulvae]MBT8154927.1 D-glycerate dehydrogenase [Epibacterium ulvae]